MTAAAVADRVYLSGFLPPLYFALDREDLNAGKHLHQSAR